ncbi:cytochrome P450 [Apiospora arundinis]|uniref:Cytochrome P450 n=1 Tax=Apiospora arundinis TaxID=335852 RepID=A0ABR2IS85_9PEZI
MNVQKSFTLPPARIRLLRVARESTTANNEILKMLQAVLVGIACVVFVAYGVDRLYAFLDDPREPCRISPKIPIIGHVLGFMYYGFDYIDILSQQTDEEVWSIGVLGFKMYITHVIRLTNIIQKTRTLSTRPFWAIENRIHTNTSEEAHVIFPEILGPWLTRSKQALAPGPGIDVVSLRMAEESNREVSALLRQGETGLLAWVKHVAVQVTSIAMFGTHHPFRDPELVEAMWTWDEYRPYHQIGADVLGTGKMARAKVGDAFQEYFRNMPDDVSLIIRERQEVLREAGLNEPDIARMQSFFSDTYHNILPQLYWTLYEVFSRPELLTAIRQEILSNALGDHEKTGGGGPQAQNRVLDLAALKMSCPLLLATYQEMQRHRHARSMSRFVVEDTLLDGRFLLKKGHYLQMPVQSVHMDTSLWGPTAAVFDPYRFMPAAAEKSIDGKASAEAAAAGAGAGAEGGGNYTNSGKIRPNSFLPWGTAPYTCPGRQFASTEVLVVTALLVLRADLTPVAGKGGAAANAEGRWERDPAVRTFEKATMPRPRREVRVRVAAREGAGEWRVALGQGGARIPLASG